MAPKGRSTRGKTRPGRLKALDDALVYVAGETLHRVDGAWRDAVFVDLGFGEVPATTLEAAARFRQGHPGLRVVGVDIEHHRVAAAQQHAQPPQTTFRHGGFDLPLAPDEPARLVRAMNVLRQYRPEQVDEAHMSMASSLLPGGLLVEGTCDKTGAVLTAHMLRRSGDVEVSLRREALIFATNFQQGFAPLLFRDRLPRDLRRAVKAGTAIGAFFDDWIAAWGQVRAEGRVAPRDVFAATAYRLALVRPGVVPDAWLLERGALMWRPAEGVPVAGQLAL